MRYTSTLISKTIKGVDGVERLYKARKISAIWASKECFKLAKVLIPAGGAAVDAVMDKKERDDLLLDPVSSTFGSMLSMFTSHVEDEHWDDLSRKLLGSLQLGDKEITDLDDHFDNYQGDYFEVLIWLFTENFKDFFLQQRYVSFFDRQDVGVAESRNEKYNRELKERFTKRNQYAVLDYVTSSSDRNDMDVEGWFFNVANSEFCCDSLSYIRNEMTLGEFLELDFQIAYYNDLKRAVELDQKVQEEKDNMNRGNR
ncbi:tail assembly chaperone [Shewanella sp. phage 1/40]|uniref:tail assembly chaperone n=1 Tax=Shewanella phage 1/4 TaxID=1458859 RepID=UPI0004F933B5|nr:tail assembly chaperone [Shewanella sp. phage 1/4]YP_009104154.1 tail assembly chaperone [Shewanella sp. phage 1/40]AHK11263.1 tail assembly chaperone [Shewanella sp. phage 1/4]AHK11564.1 tail assembly chaperone [Shewanella sp. phage 1/40]